MSVLRMYRLNPRWGIYNIGLAWCWLLLEAGTASCGTSFAGGVGESSL